MMTKTLGSILYSFFVDHLTVLKGLRPSSVRSYRDALRLFLTFLEQDAHRKMTRLSLGDLTFEGVQRFLSYLENDRKNHIRTRNQRLAILHTFFEYLAHRSPEMLSISQRVAAIPMKRVAPPETRFLECDEIGILFASLPTRGKLALRDRVLLLFLYNTGARVQEVADLRWENLDLESEPRVRLHGKGDKWRTCPLWAETAHQLRVLRERQRASKTPDSPVFASQRGAPLTRFGIYKIVRRHAVRLESEKGDDSSKRISPHVFRHSAAVHLLEAGVEVNLIRGWLGHVNLNTTNRYAEIHPRAKEEALRVCEPPSEASAGFPRKPVWRDDDSLLAWLNSL
jgi:integrase/recombinase XerD